MDCVYIYIYMCVERRVGRESISLTVVLSVTYVCVAGKRGTIPSPELGLVLSRLAAEGHADVRLHRMSLSVVPFFPLENISTRSNILVLIQLFFFVKLFNR